MLEELQRLPVGYLDDVMLFQNFAQAWERFKNAESGEQEKLANEHPLFGVCREIWYERNRPSVRKARKQKS